MKTLIRKLIPQPVKQHYRYKQLKAFIHKSIPKSLFKQYQRLNRVRQQRQNQQKTAEDVFTEIYIKNMWGGAKGEFCSGAGTVNRHIVSAYISMVSEKSSLENFAGLTFVDLGCGDFRVGQQLLPLCRKYIGVDIVKSLIERNQEIYGDDSTQFVYLDITKDELPNGDVCFIRQVLQHLSNHQILVVLKKLEKYSWVFITEHYPQDTYVTEKNIDKTHGSDIRAYKNSGVYLSDTPFNLASQKLSEVLEVPGTVFEKGYDPGVIRTFLYKPKDNN